MAEGQFKYVWSFGGHQAFKDIKFSQNIFPWELTVNIC